MPFFFFIAGYCFKDKYLNDFKTFFIHRIKGLYLPFIKWTLIFVLLHNLFFHFDIYNLQYGVGNGRIWYQLSEFPNLIFAAFCFNSQEQLLGVFWFINSLFFGYFAFFLTLKITNYIKISSKWGALILFSFSFMIIYTNVYIPYIGFRTFYPALFIMLGYIYKNETISIPKKLKTLSTTTGTLILIISSFFLKTEILKVNLFTILPYTLIAFIGCVVLLHFSEILSHRATSFLNLLDNLGRHTFGIMTFHFLSFKIVSLFIIIIEGYPYGMLAAFPVITYMAPNNWWVAYSLIGIMLPLYLYLQFEKLRNTTKKI